MALLIVGGVCHEHKYTEGVVLAAFGWPPTLIEVKGNVEILLISRGSLSWHAAHGGGPVGGGRLIH